MADEATTTETQTEVTETETTAEDQRVPYERFQQANKKAKEAADRAKTLEREMADLRTQMEERENAGLPDLERERKRAEQLERRAAEAEKRAQETEQKLARSQRERLISAAASAANFADPTDASAFVDLDDIEDDKDAERAVKQLAKRKPHLLKPEETKLPGKVLSNGAKTTERQHGQPGFDKQAEAEAVGQALGEFLKSRQSTGITFGA